MTDVHHVDDEQILILAAEECPEESFDVIHKFTKSDQKIIRKLIAHGPVLLRGGRGTGKSAYLIKAYLEMMAELKSSVFPIYLSLRYLPLLRSAGTEYDRHFCKILSERIRSELRKQQISELFDVVQSIDELHIKIHELAERINKRIILLFDDAAHIGRERPLTEFFDIFRTLSTNVVSCKASIYPGVTKFGIRFDIFNDAFVIDINRDERNDDFVESFSGALSARFPGLMARLGRSRSLEVDTFCLLLGRGVSGNMRAFIFACNFFEEHGSSSVGYPEMTTAFLSIASNYFWPLLEEVAPKLGMYEPLVAPSEKIARHLFDLSADKKTGYVLVHREIVQKFGKIFEILEYAGFISKRDASRAMKSGGRGTVYAVNLCNLLEAISGNRLTVDLSRTLTNSKEVAELHVSSNFVQGVELPALSEDADLRILDLNINMLEKSDIYPYGLTKNKIDKLKDAGFQTIGQLAEAKDHELLRIDTIGSKSLGRIRDVVYQAIWM